MLARGGAAIASPKLTSAERRESFFPYYAGFSENFVCDVLDALQASNGQIIIDPWNGSGTTTAVASRAGLQSVGVDINPALTVVAKARLASAKEVLAAQDLVSATAGRKLSQSFLRAACDAPHSSMVRSVLLLAVFRLVRKKLRELGLVASNPTWWNLNVREVKCALSAISQIQLISELDVLAASLSKRPALRGKTTLVQRDILANGFAPNSADIVITSPPYLTRIDYVKATLPELLTLSLLAEIQVNQLRKTMIGSPVIGKGADFVPTQIGEYAKSLLSLISEHSSKASSTYYSAFFTTYISKMFRAFEVLNHLTRPGAKMVFVVQGSHYKEIFVDLARLTADFAQASGFSYISRADFQFKQSFAQLNPRANGYNLETAQETALLFERSA